MYYETKPRTCLDSLPSALPTFLIISHPSAGVLWKWNRADMLVHIPTIIFHAILVNMKVYCLEYHRHQPDLCRKYCLVLSRDDLLQFLRHHYHFKVAMENTYAFEPVENSRTQYRNVRIKPKKKKVVTSQNVDRSFTCPDEQEKIHWHNFEAQVLLCF